MKKDVTDKITLSNEERGSRYVYYAKRMSDDMSKFQIVMCIEDEQGFRQIDHPEFNHLGEKKALWKTKALNETLGMENDLENVHIVASTMVDIKRR